MEQHKQDNSYKVCIRESWVVPDAPTDRLARVSASYPIVLNQQMRFLMAPKSSHRCED